MWTLNTTKTYDEWYNALSDAAKTEVLAKMEMLRTNGPQLKRPHADTLNGSKYPNMKELRAKTPDQVLRVAFSFDPKREAILLIGGDKSGVGQKVSYRQLIDRADALYGEHLSRLAK